MVALVVGFKDNMNSVYQDLKERVFKQNQRLIEKGLVVLTWGNVSEIDREKGVVAIKPSGVSFEKMKVEDIVIIDLNGNVIEGQLKPSSDTPTHLELYRCFPHIGGVCHTHATYSVSFAQAKKPVIPYGTTHADSFYGIIPCTRELNKEEINGDYELNTGKVIVEAFLNKDYEATPAVLVASHGPFSWGKDAKAAVDNAIILEKICQMNLLTDILNPSHNTIDENLERKHHERKHGVNAYYGQKGD